MHGRAARGLRLGLRGDGELVGGSGERGLTKVRSCRGRVLLMACRAAAGRLLSCTQYKQDVFTAVGVGLLRLDGLGLIEHDSLASFGEAGPKQVRGLILEVLKLETEGSVGR